MKKTTSFHLEEDILNEITAYQKQYNLSSRNVALERMLLERRFLLTAPVTGIQADSNTINVEQVKEEQPRQYERIGKSIDSSFDTMQE